MLERRYDASDGQEVFLSYEYQQSQQPLLCGFLRLRLPLASNTASFPELCGVALVRELHVYGQLQPTAEALLAAAGNSRQGDSASQHSGLGRKLLERAEAIAVSEGWCKMAVISGVGARNYYRKFGYELVEANQPGEGGYLLKDLPGQRDFRCGLGVCAAATAAAIVMATVLARR